ncbi:MAG: DUF1295 domain-containing protein [bacterium]|nr:DUF1295 domain-containing protein [bacterium]
MNNIPQPGWLDYGWLVPAGLGWAAIAVMMTVFFLIQRKTQNAAIVDVGWPLSLLIMAAAYAVYAPGGPVRAALVCALAALWSLRLAGYVFFTRVIRGEEDGRYTTLREHWGASAQRNLFLFFQAQGVLGVVFSIPFWIVMRSGAPAPGAFDLAGAALGLIAVFGETLADRQLWRHKSNPDNRGKTCRAGLWRYSRHPNYFFEWLFWWSFVVMGLGAPSGYLTLIGPVLMFYFLYRVTGIPYAEAQALKSRGDDYRRYQQTTSPFIPWFPKEDPS